MNQYKLFYYIYLYNLSFNLMFIPARNKTAEEEVIEDLTLG